MRFFSIGSRYQNQRQKPGFGHRLKSTQITTYLPFGDLVTRGPPESPSQESAPPLAVPAHKKILGIHSF